MGHFRAFVSILVLVCFSSSTSVFSNENDGSNWISDFDWFANSKTFSDLNKILDTFNYYDTDTTLRTLDRINEPHAKILAETIIILHLSRMFGTSRHYTDQLGQKVKEWEKIGPANFTRLNDIFSSISKYYIYMSEDKNKEEKFELLSSLIIEEPKNYIDAWVQCTVSIDSQIATFNLTQEFQQSFLELKCPSKYGLSHLPVAGLAMVSINEGFNIQMNNSIAKDLYQKANQSIDFYARVDCYVALVGIGTAVRQSDMVLAVREMGHTLKKDLEAVGFTSEALLYAELFADLNTNLTFSNLTSPSEILLKYEKIVRLYPSVSEFIEFLDLDHRAVTLLFLRSIDHAHVKDFGQALILDWQKIVASEQRSWEDITTWITVADIISWHQRDDLDEPENALLTLKQMISIHDAHYKDPLERFDANKLKSNENKKLAEALNNLAGPLEADREVNPGIFRTHADLGKQLLYLDKNLEAFEQLELAWSRLPDHFRLENRTSVNILSNLTLASRGIGDMDGASKYAELVLKNWTNIFQKNNNNLFIQEFENDWNARFTIVMAMYNLLAKQYDEEYGSREYNRLEDLIFKCIQILRMNRVTFANKIINKADKVEAIDTLSRLNNKIETNNKNNSLTEIFNENNLIQNRAFELVDSSDLIWKVPKDTLILLAYETGDDVHFAVMGTGYIDPMFAVIELDELVPKINSVMESIKPSDGYEFQSFDYANATWIYNQIFENEFSKHTSLDEFDNLIFLPSKSLFNFPLGILSTGKSINQKVGEHYVSTEFLIDKLNISYFLDFNERLRSSVLAEFMSDKAQTSPVTSQTFLGLGNPNFGSLNTAEYRAISFIELEGQLVSEASFESLPETEDEIFEVSKFFSEEGSEVLVWKNATKNNLKNRELDQFDVLMFSTHGINQNIDKGYGKTALVLGWGDDKKDNLNNILLKPEEIIQLNLNADLTILNACNSGLPNAKNAPGLTGIAQSFLAAGSEAIMVSNWSIASKTTVELMSRMFGYLKNNSKASFNSALIYAQRSLKSDAKTSHPFFWAPYSIYGNF